MATRRTLEEQIELAQEEIKKKEAHIKQLLQRQRSKADKERTHRLCKRGGLVESLLPGLDKLTDEQFDKWVKKTLLSGFALKAINELSSHSADTKDVTPAPQNAAPAPQKPANTQTNSNVPDYEKAAYKQHNSAAHSTANNGNHTRQTS